LAAIYAVVLVLFIYRISTVGQVWGTARDSVSQTVMIYGILIGSGLLTAVLTRLGLSSELTAMIAEADTEPWQFLLAINLLMIVLGMFLDGISLIVLLSLVLFPMANAVGINPIHFAVIITALVEIATLTPPIGLHLLVMSRITKLPVQTITRSVLPFYSVQLPGLLVINAVPLLSLALLP